MYAAVVLSQLQAKKAAAAPPAKKKAAAPKKKKNFYGDDDEDEDEDDEDDEDDEEADVPLADDHALLLRVILPLLRSRNSGVVLGVAALYHYVGPKDRAVQGRIGKALVRIMRGNREVTYVVLTNCVEFARAAPEMFKKYLKDFFIAVRSPRVAPPRACAATAALAPHVCLLLSCATSSLRSFRLSLARVALPLRRSRSPRSCGA